MDDVAVGAMSLAEVTSVLSAFHGAGIRYWLEGGWGVDALVGHQTRPHRDLDVDLDSAHEAQALDVLTQLGYSVETDWRPNRVELAAPSRGRVDLHPLLLDQMGLFVKPPSAAVSTYSRRPVSPLATSVR